MIGNIVTAAAAAKNAHYSDDIGAIASIRATPLTSNVWRDQRHISSAV